MGKQPKAVAWLGKKRGAWTPEEDKKLLAYVQQHGHGNWRFVPEKAGLQRCGKSCRLRWRNYLNPDVKRGNFSLEEDQIIIQLHALLGNRWSTIAAQLPKRTDNEIKNYWNSHLKKRLDKIGFDPVTHKPKTAIVAFANGGDPKSQSNLSHVAQWESARLQAEARFSSQSKRFIRYDQPPRSGPVPVPQCLDMNERAGEILLALKSILAADNYGDEGGGGTGSTATLVGQEGGIFGNVDVEGIVSSCDKFEAPRNGMPALNFDDVFGEYYHNNVGFEVGNSTWSLEQCEILMMSEQ